MNYDDLAPGQLVDLLSDKTQRHAVIVALVGGITSTELRHVKVDEATRQALLGGLKHPNSQVRWWCIQLMDHLAVRSYVEPLLAAAHTDPVPKNRRHAIHALTCDMCKPDGCGLDIGIEADLAVIVRTDSDWSVRMLALEELSAIAGPAATWQLVASLPGREQGAFKAILKAQETGSSLHLAMACARSVPGWRGQMAYRLLIAADHLIQAAVTVLLHGDISSVRAKLQSSLHLVTGDYPASGPQARPLEDEN